MDIFQEIFNYIQDGLIIMDRERKIKKMNPAAEQLTGWKMGDSVPYCSFCENRYVTSGEERCYLIGREEVPYFSSQMPAYSGKQIQVEMSTALIVPSLQSSGNEYLLVLRDKDKKAKEQEAQNSKQLIKLLTEAKEDEHKRLAQELHDGVGQSLYTISLALEAISDHKTKTASMDYLHEVKAELDRVIREVNNYSQRLRPQTLDDLGLYDSLLHLKNTLKASFSDVHIELDCSFRERLDPMYEINIFRVLQEAVHNSLKYASASVIQVVVYRSNQYLYFHVTDNGVGFEVEKNELKGLGLQHMRERVEHLNGVISISSAEKEGTMINGQIPLKEAVV